MDAYGFWEGKVEVLPENNSFETDDIGYFVFHPLVNGKHAGKVRVEHYTPHPQNMPTWVAVGSRAEDIYKAIAHRFPEILPSHIGYVAKELERAFMSSAGLEYTQG